MTRERGWSTSSDRQLPHHTRRAHCRLMRHSRPIDRCWLVFISTASFDPKRRTQRFLLHEAAATAHPQTALDPHTKPRESSLAIKPNLPRRDRRHPSIVLVFAAPRRSHLSRSNLQVRFFCHSCSAPTCARQGDEALCVSLPRWEVGIAILCA
jgi:hypothetical protein